MIGVVYWGWRWGWFAVDLSRDPGFVFESGRWRWRF